jgi:hypothetical protein
MLSQFNEGPGVSALVGILVPEFHSRRVPKLSLGLFTSPAARGLAITRAPGFLN